MGRSRFGARDVWKRLRCFQHVSPTLGVSVNFEFTDTRVWCSKFFANSKKFSLTSLVIGYFAVSTHYVGGTRKKASFVTCPDFSLSHIVGGKTQSEHHMSGIVK